MSELKFMTAAIYIRHRRTKRCKWREETIDLGPLGEIELNEKDEIILRHINPIINWFEKSGTDDRLSEKFRQW